MTKLEVQKRVLKEGKPLDLDVFNWDEKTNTFSSNEHRLVIDFNSINYCAFKTGSDCTFKTGSNCTFDTDSECTFKTGSNCTFDTDSDCTFDTGSNCTFNTDSNCTFDTGYECTFKTGSDCTFKTGYNCTFDTGSKCTFKTGSDCTFKTGYNCTFDTGSECTFDTGSNCTFNTCSNCTFKTGSNCTFDTGSNCTFDTGSECTFDTGYECTFNTSSECTFKTGSECTFDTGSKCVIVRKDNFLVIQPQENEIIRLNPHNLPGFLSKEKDDDKFYLNRDKSLGEHIIVDDILSNVLSKKGNIFKVKNYNDEHISYIIKDGDIYSHGKTIKEAKDSLMYKISNRDTSMYKDLTLESIVTKEQAIKIYRTITGACEYGTRYFVENNKSRIEEFTINDVIQLTEGQFGNEEFKKFFSI